MIYTIIHAFALTTWIYILIYSYKANKSNELRSIAIFGSWIVIFHYIDVLLEIMKAG